MARAAGGPLPGGTVTFLFTDIEGSTRLLRAFGGQWGDVLETRRRLIRDAAGEHGAVELGTDGDAVKLAFTRASNAIGAAIAIQQAIAAHEWPDDEEVRIRIGVHTGDVEVRGDDYVGITLHLAARVAAAGHGGQIVVTETARALVGECETIDLGELVGAADALRGRLGHRHRVWELSGHRRALAALEGQRDATIDEMLRRGRGHSPSTAAAAARDVLSRPLP